jgi:tryptophan-rich sensory protein
MNNNLIPYLLFFFPIVIGFSSNLFIGNIKKPKIRSKFNPPSWIFAPVWTILYLLLGYVLCLIYKFAPKYLYLYIIQIILVTVWFPLFVNYPNRFYSTASLIILTIYAIILAYLAYNVNKTATYCLMPYIAWLCFASFLASNTSIE